MLLAVPVGATEQHLPLARAAAEPAAFVDEAARVPA
jgi:creatinine amidohydrolase/Fe(II)-dependent formamide hydrolase-like protein